MYKYIWVNDLLNMKFCRRTCSTKFLNKFCLVNAWAHWLSCIGKKTWMHQDIDRILFVAVRCCVHSSPSSLATTVASSKMLCTLRTNDRPTDRPLKYGMFHKFGNVPVFWSDVGQILQKHQSILVQNVVFSMSASACDFACLSDGGCQHCALVSALALIYVFIWAKKQKCLCFHSWIDNNNNNNNWLLVSIIWIWVSSSSSRCCVLVFEARVYSPFYSMFNFTVYLFFRPD